MKNRLVKFLTAWLFKVSSPESVMMLAVDKVRANGNKVEVKWRR